jgi:hypothetical protein
MQKRVKFINADTKTDTVIHGFYLNENFKRQLKKMFGTKRYADMFPNLDVVYLFNPKKKKYDVYVGCRNGILNLSHKGMKQFAVLTTIADFMHDQNRPKLCEYVLHSSKIHRNRLATPELINEFQLTGRTNPFNVSY